MSEENIVPEIDDIENLNEDTIEQLIDGMIPEEREDVKKIITNLTTTLIEKEGQLQAMQQELKDALRRRKAKNDPLLGHVAMALISKPKIQGSLVKMHTADNVQTTQAIQSIKSLMRDPDSQFIAAAMLMPMAGKDDMIARLAVNTEAARHLYISLRDQLKIEESKLAKETPEEPES